MNRLQFSTAQRWYKKSTGLLINFVSFLFLAWCEIWEDAGYNPPQHIIQPHDGGCGNVPVRVPSQSGRNLTQSPTIPHSRKLLHLPAKNSGKFYVGLYRIYGRVLLSGGGVTDGKFRGVEAQPPRLSQSGVT